jgi:hypothetical protein
MKKEGKQERKKGWGRGRNHFSIVTIKKKKKKKPQKRMGEGQEGRSNFSIATIKMVAGRWGGGGGYNSLRQVKSNWSEFIQAVSQF